MLSLVGSGARRGAGPGEVWVLFGGPGPGRVRGRGGLFGGPGLGGVQNLAQIVLSLIWDTYKTFRRTRFLHLGFLVNCSVTR